MRKLVGLLTVFIIVITIFIFMPFICGIYLQHHFNNVLAFYSSPGNTRVQLTHYKRHWFTSDATITLEIINPKFNAALITLGITYNVIPKKYIIDQHIQHGPLIYHTIAEPSSIFGMAAIQSKLQLSPQMLIFLQQLGVNTPFTQINDDLVTFSGKYFKHFKIGLLDKKYLESRVHLKINSLEGHLWIWPGQPHFSGDLVLQATEMTDESNSLIVPRIILQFDQKQNNNHLWLGSSALLIPDMALHTENDDSLSIKYLKFSGFVEEVTGMLNASRQFDIAKFKINDETIGPVHLQIKANGVNSKALFNLIQAYREIMQRGELYQSQLKQKMLLMLPSLINSGTRIQLDALDIDTSAGKLQINGGLVWDMDNASVPDDVGELVTAANGQMNLHIAKKLLDKCIQLATYLPGFSQPTPELQHIYWAARQDMYFAMQHNNYIIAVFKQNNLLSEASAIALLQLMRERVPLQDYAAELRRLLFNRTISLTTGYWLYWQYTEIERPLSLMAAVTQQNQDAIRQSLHEQLDQWIKAGYVVVDYKDYVVSIKQEQGKIKINGRDVTQP